MIDRTDGRPVERSGSRELAETGDLARASADTLDPQGANQATDPAALLRRIPAGTKIGRYVIVSELGAGGMGVVYAAFDRELDRKVALKVLRSDLLGTGSEAGARLLREAQALARLTHPNVVAVFDAGTHNDDVWIAMEFVAGRTLGQWLRERRWTWREVSAVMTQVVLGLAAAHRAGLIHRDVKPDNVMIADDGRVRVMDFGLARASEDETRPQPEADLRTTGGRRVLDEVLTMAGSTPGTPAYMSPEQFLGGSLDARTDQFSFCVMMWEALYQRSPFAGDAGGARVLDVLEGRIQPAPRRSGVPTWMHRVLLRGLQVLPGDRWPSMEALLEGMKRGRARSRVLKGMVAVSTIGFVGLGTFALERVDTRKRVAACETRGAEISEIWNDERKASLRRSLLASGAPDAATTAEKVMPWIDAAAHAWRGAQTDTCLDVEVHHVWDAELAERSRWCLEERFVELSVAIDELSDADAAMMRKAVATVAALDDVEPCRDAARLRLLPPPPRNNEDFLEAREQLARAHTLATAGKYEEALVEGRGALQKAQELAWPPLSAQARLELGMSLHFLGRDEECVGVLEDAFFEADRVGALEESADAAGNLVAVVGYRLAQPEQAQRWSRHAERAIEILGEQDHLRGAELRANLGVVAYVAGDYPRAEELWEGSVATIELVLGPNHPNLAGPIENLASIHAATARPREARENYERAVAIEEAALGPRHPTVGRSIGNLAGTYLDEGNYVEAGRLYERSLKILEDALGPDHLDISFGLNNLGSVAEALGEEGRAKALYERGLAIKEAQLGLDHPDLASSLTNLGSLQQRLGDYEHAERLQLRALAIWEAKLGPDHPHVAAASASLAAVHRDTGRLDEARVGFERSLAIWEKALGSDHPDLSFALIGLGSVALAAGKPSDAIPPVERALTLLDSPNTPTERLADGRFLLAKVLWEATAEGGRDRARALELATLAQAALVDMPAVAKPTEVEAWLAERTPKGTHP